AITEPRGEVSGGLLEGVAAREERGLVAVHWCLRFRTVKRGLKTVQGITPCAQTGHAVGQSSLRVERPPPLLLFPPGRHPRPAAAAGGRARRAAPPPTPGCRAGRPLRRSCTPTSSTPSLPPGGAWRVARSTP